MEIPENNKSSMNTQVPPPPLPPPALNSITPTTGGGGVGPSASGPLRTMVTHHQGVNLTQPLSSSSQSQQTQQQQQSPPPPPPPPPSSVPTSFSPSLSSQRRNFATPFTAPTPPSVNNAAVMSQPSQFTTNSDDSPPNNSIPSSKSADKVKRRITGQALPSLSGITKKISKDGLTNILPKRSSSPNKQPRQAPPPPPPAIQKQNPQKLYEDIPLSPEEFSLEKETDFFLSGHLTKPEPLPSIESGQALLRIQTLASRRAWGDVMHLTGEYLQNSPYSVFEKELVNCDTVFAYDEKDDEGKEDDDEHKQKLQAETNHLIFYRLYSMLKLRRYADLGREIERFNLVEFQYPYTSPKNNKVKEQGQDDGEEEEDSEAISFLPKWVSFGLKLLAAQSLQYTDKPQRCIDVLHSLEKDLLKNQYKNSAFSRKWLPRIYVAVSNAFLRLQEWRMALSALDKLYDMLSVSTTLYDMLDMEQNNQYFENEEEKEDYNELQSILTNASEIEIRTRQIRIFLQLGGIDQAQQLHESVLQNYEDFQKLYLSFDSLTKQWMNPSSFILVHQIPTHISLNSGLIDFAYGNYQKAMQNFSEALVSMQQAQKKISGYSMDEQKSSYCVHNFLSSSVFLSLDPDMHVMTHCVNNLGLCSLYLNQVDYAISVMETLIKENPTMYLTEVLVFNLCTLYELVYDPDKCTQEKKVLQSVAKRFYLHDVGGENFRIT